LGGREINSSVYKSQLQKMKVERICRKKETQLFVHETAGMSKVNACSTAVCFDIIMSKIPILYSILITNAYW
jgi:hypothetical protein